MEKENEILVEVKGLSKKFSRSLRRSMWYGLKDVVNSMFGLSGKKSKLRKEEFWAIKDIGFQLRRGECLGLIGHNGVGKSTLLKMLNGLIRPDEGSIIMRGKVGALIELGAGFNPILTGRENIYVNGQLIGFSKKEIDEKLNAILDFAEIGEFIDSPIQNYSSGMKVRLGFAIAAQMEPDVLIIDEVLSVGDLGFVLKCFNAIDKMINKTAVIFVSHSMPQISRICTSIALLEKGKAIFQGTDVSRGIDFYYSKFANANQAIFSDNKNAEFIGVDFLADDFINGIPIYKWNMELAMRIKFHTAIEIDQPCLAVTFMDKEQRPIGIWIDRVSKSEKLHERKDRLFYDVKLTLPQIQFSKGVYSIAISISESETTKPFLRIQNVANFQVTSKKQVWPPFELYGEWE